MPQTSGAQTNLVPDSGGVTQVAPMRPTHPLHRYLLKAALHLPKQEQAMLRLDLAKRACAAGAVKQGLSLTTEFSKSACLASHVVARTGVAQAYNELEWETWSLHRRSRISAMLTLHEASEELTSKALLWQRVQQEVYAVKDVDERLELAGYVLSRAKLEPTFRRAWIRTLMQWVAHIPYPSLRANRLFALAHELDALEDGALLTEIAQDQLPGPKRVESFMDARLMMRHALAHQQWERAWLWAYRAEDLNNTKPNLFESLIQVLLNKQEHEQLLSFAARHTPDDTPLWFYTEVASQAIRQKQDALASRALSMTDAAFAEDRAQSSILWQHHNAQVFQARGKHAQALKQWEAVIKAVRRDDFDDRLELDRLLRYGPRMIATIWMSGHHRLALSLLDVMQHVSGNRGRLLALNALPAAMDSATWARAMRKKRTSSWMTSMPGPRVMSIDETILADLPSLLPMDAVFVSRHLLRLCTSSPCKARALKAMVKQLQRVPSKDVLSTFRHIDPASWPISIAQRVAWVRQQPESIQGLLWFKMLKGVPPSHWPSELLVSVSQDVSTNKQRVGARRSLRLIVSHLVETNRCDLALSVQSAQLEPLSLGSQSMEGCTNPSHIEAKVLLTAHLDVPLQEKLSRYAKHLGHLPKMDWRTLFAQLDALEEYSSAQTPD